MLAVSTTAECSSGINAGSGELFPQTVRVSKRERTFLAFRAHLEEELRCCDTWHNTTQSKAPWLDRRMTNSEFDWASSFVITTAADAETREAIGEIARRVVAACASWGRTSARDNGSRLCAAILDRCQWQFAHWIQLRRMRIGDDDTDAVRLGTAAVLLVAHFCALGCVPSVQAVVDRITHDLRSTTSSRAGGSAMRDDPVCILIATVTELACRNETHQVPMKRNSSRLATL